MTNEDDLPELFILQNIHYVLDMRVEAHIREGEMNSRHEQSGLVDLALFGGRKRFAVPKSTSNLVQPSIERFLDYARPMFDAPGNASGGTGVVAGEFLILFQNASASNLSPPGPSTSNKTKAE